MAVITLGVSTNFLSDKFGELSKVDLELLADILSKKVTFEVVCGSDIRNEGSCEFNGSISEFIKDIDIEEFVLRKVRKVKSVSCSLDDDGIISSCFNNFQDLLLNKLFNGKFIMVVLENGSYFIKLTKRGDMRLFLEDNKNEMERFRILLEGNGYDVNLLDSFLITQDLSENPSLILTLEKFDEFVNRYMRPGYCPHQLVREIKFVPVSSNE